MAPGGSITLDVLVNDKDPDRDLDPSSLRLATAPRAGAATVVSGRLRYRAPDPGAASAADSFAYAVEDRAGNCSTARVLITIG